MLRDSVSQHLCCEVNKFETSQHKCCVTLQNKCCGTLQHNCCVTNSVPLPIPFFHSAGDSVFSIQNKLL